MNVIFEEKSYREEKEMKFRRILSLLVSLMILLSFQTTGFSQSYTDVKSSDDYYEAVEALSSLGIIKGYGEGDFQPEGKITRAEFATVIMRILGMKGVEATRANTVFDDVKSTHWASGSIESAYNAGIINGMSLKYDENGNVVGGAFEPESEVTYDQSIKMIVCALGYQKKAVASVAKGVNPFPTGYNIVAQQKKITDGTTRTSGATDRATVAKLVYNALTVNLMDQVSYGTNESFEEIKNQSLLYSKIGAIKVDAKITRIPLDKTDKRVDLEILDHGFDSVAVANGDYNTKYALTRIYKGDVDLTGLQGLSVTAIVDVSDAGEEVLLSVFPKYGKNHELSIEPSLYKGISGTKICYYKDIDASTYNSSSKVKAPFNIYLNLVNVATASTDSSIAATVANYAVQHGVGGVSTNDNLYKFVDTDGDDYYDTLYITNSASFVVDRTDEHSLEIYPQNTTSVLNSSTVFNCEGDYEFSPLCLDGDEITYTIRDASGTILDFDEIGSKDVVTVYMSKDSSNYHYDIVVSNSKSITGTITDVSQVKLKDTNTYVTYYRINGIDYRVNRDASSSKLEAGSSGKFYLTDNGRIISFNMDSTIRNYAAAINVARAKSNFDTGIQTQLFDGSGNIKVYNFASTYYVNNQVYKASDADVNSLKSNIAGKIVIYELNKNGDIKKLYYGSSGFKLVDEDYKLYENVSTPASYRYSSEKLGSAYLNDNTSIVAIENPANYTSSTEYSLVSRYALTDGGTYNCYILADSSKEAKFVLLSGYMTVPQYDTYPLIVTGISSSYYNGEARTRLTGYVGNDEVSYVLASDDNLTFIDMAGNVEGSAFTTSQISNSYSAYSLALTLKNTADETLTLALTAKNEADSKVSEATAESEKAQTELIKAQSKLESAKETLKQLKTNSQTAQQALALAQSEKLEAEKTYNIAQANKTAADSELTQALSEKENAQTAYKTAVNALEQAEASYKSAEETLKTANEKLIASQKAQTTAQTSVTELTNEQNKLSTTLLPLKNELETANKNFETVKTALESAKSVLKAKELLKENIEKELAVTKTKSETAKKVLDTLKDELTTLQAKENLLKASKEATEEMLKEFSEQIAAKKTEISKAQTAYDTASSDVTKLTAELADAITQLKTAQTNAAVAQASFDKAEEKLYAAKKAIADAGSDEDIDKQLENAQKALSEAKVNIAIATADIKTATENKEKASSQIEEFTLKVSESKADADSKTKQYDNIKAKSDELNMVFTVAGEALTLAETRLTLAGESASTTSIEQAEYNVTVAQTEVNSLQTAYDEKQLTLSQAQSDADEKNTLYETAVSQQTQALTALNLVTVSSNSAPLSVAKSININDVLQIALNANDEIVSYRHLAKYYNNSVYVMVSDTNYEDSSTQISASLVEYPLNSGIKDILSDRSVFNGKVVKTGLKMTGYGVGGRVSSVRGRSIELFDTTSPASTYADAIAQVKDLSYNSNDYAYYIGLGYSKPKYSSASSVKTFETYNAGTSEENIKKALDRADDIVYMYKYDGDTYLTLIIDSLSNNK